MRHGAHAISIRDAHAAKQPFVPFSCQCFHSSHGIFTGTWAAAGDEGGTRVLALVRVGAGLTRAKPSGIHYNLIVLSQCSQVGYTGAEVVCCSGEDSL